MVFCSLSQIRSKALRQQMKINTVIVIYWETPKVSENQGWKSSRCICIFGCFKLSEGNLVSIVKGIKSSGLKMR